MNINDYLFSNKVIKNKSMLKNFYILFSGCHTFISKNFAYTNQLKQAHLTLFLTIVLL